MSGAPGGRLIRRSGRCCQPGGSRACSGALLRPCASRPTSGPFSLPSTDIGAGDVLVIAARRPRRNGDDRRDSERTVAAARSGRRYLRRRDPRCWNAGAMGGFLRLHASCHARAAPGPPSAAPSTRRSYSAAGLYRPGDLLIGDDDGLGGARPRSRSGAASRDAEAKLRREAEWQESLAGGRSMAETFGLAEPTAIGEPAREVP